MRFGGDSTNPDAPQALRTFYDAVAARYDLEVDGLEGNAELRDVFRRRVSAMAASGPILDFGCGTGIDAAWYAAHGHRVIAYDPSPGMVNVLRSRCADGINQGVVLPLDGELKKLFEALKRIGPVAMVAANFAVLNHVAELRPLLQELASHLVPEGALVASV